jgi:hypothetical protein
VKVTMTLMVSQFWVIDNRPERVKRRAKALERLQREFLHRKRQYRLALWTGDVAWAQQERDIALKVAAKVIALGGNSWHVRRWL